MTEAYNTPSHYWRISNTEQEFKFLKDFPRLVSDIAIGTVAVKLSSKKPIKHLSQYALEALTPSVELYDEYKGSRAITGYAINKNPGIEYSYNSPDNRPYVDTRYGLGLIYESWLVALAGLSVDNQGNISVEQLQDVSGTKKGHVLFHETGLRKNNLLWRHTLVSAAMHIGKVIGSENIIVTSHTNSVWQQTIENGQASYDDVAESLGFVQSELTRPKGNWIKPLT